MQMRDEQGHKTKEEYYVQKGWQRGAQETEVEEEGEGDAWLVRASAKEQLLVD